MTKHRPKSPPSKEPHAPKFCEEIRRPVCTRCGLVYLKNDATRRAIDQPCPDDKWDWRHD